MATQTREFKAKTIDDAIEEGLRTLTLARDDVEIEIVQKGSRGIFGLGSEPAIVRLTPRAIPPVTVPTEIASTVPSAVTGSVKSVLGEVPVPPVAEQSAMANPVVPIPPAMAPPEPRQSDQLEASVEEDTSPQGWPKTDTEATPMVPSASTANVDEDEDETNENESDEELMTLAATLLREMVHLMGFEAEVYASWQTEDEATVGESDEEDEGQSRSDRYLLLDIEGTELGALIGRRGETLENMQYLLRLMVNQKLHQWKNIVIDVEHYKARRVTQLIQLSERMAEQVARTGRMMSLEPMPSNERRIIHMTLREHPDVYTESHGDGVRRKVHIFAKS
jgi:spoIIIJ-associated protein